MTANDIRQKFLDFFASKGHRIVASDSLVPKDDPTVLFTTAGMQQFKRQFLGYVGDYARAASSQKCLRTDDLDQVGKTDFHHTFFEMLGNFSFGDYFKREAISWAWEFLTQELRIVPEKLWVSVYKDDEEAERIWLKEIKIDPKRLVRLGDHSNFWPADAKEKGPNGPCGPCSEIFYDYGVNPHCSSKKCDPSCDCGRFSEVWNLVFTQFNRQEGGVLEPLPNKNIDTGMGLERLAAVVQGKKSNYETDLFSPIFGAIDQFIGRKNLTRTQTHVIADHIRAIVFGIADGVVPSNEGRGYVVKRLIIDIADIALQQGCHEPVIYKLVPAIAQTMHGVYPELNEKAEDIAGIIRSVETSYRKVRQERIPALQEKFGEIKRLPSLQIPAALGQTMFVYRDTYGLTLSTIVSVMDSAGITAADKDMAQEEFLRLMAQQQKKSREASKMTGDVFLDTGLELDVPKTDFRGYEHTSGRGTVLGLFIGNRKVHEVSQGDHVQVVLDKTPFYAEAGGQVGDAGCIKGPGGKVRVTDTQKINDVYVHAGTVEEGLLKIGEHIETEIDLPRRLAIMRHHTATHLLQAALREVLGAHVQQQGSLVAEDRLRFDFTHPRALTNEELMKIEERVNEYVLRCDEVTKAEMSIQQARACGALAFFAEKYGEQVRVVSIGDYSKEFCGGAHLNSTGQIGVFKITSESAIAQGIRRIEAKAGREALAFIHAKEKQIQEAASILKSPEEEVVERIAVLSRRLRQLEKDVEKYQLEAVRSSVDGVIQEAQTCNGAKIISHFFKGLELGILRQVCDLIKQKTKSSVIVLGAAAHESGSIVVAVTDDLVEKGIKADEIIKEIAFLTGGSGGGRPQLAQAGSKHAGKVEEAIQKANQIIREKMTR